MELFTRGQSPYFLIGGKMMRPTSGRPSPELTVLAGHTVDRTGAALGGVTVELFIPGINLLMGTTVSDGSGNFSFSVGLGQVWQLEGYLAGSPDLAGITRVDVALGSANMAG